MWCIWSENFIRFLFFQWMSRNSERCSVSINNNTHKVIRYEFTAHIFQLHSMQQTPTSNSQYDLVFISHFANEMCFLQCSFWLSLCVPVLRSFFFAVSLPYLCVSLFYSLFIFTLSIFVWLSLLFLYFFIPWHCNNVWNVFHSQI